MKAESAALILQSDGLLGGAGVLPAALDLRVLFTIVL